MRSKLLLITLALVFVVCSAFNKGCATSPAPATLSKVDRHIAQAADSLNLAEKANHEVALARLKAVDADTTLKDAERAAKKASIIEERREVARIIDDANQGLIEATDIAKNLTPEQFNNGGREKVMAKLQEIANGLAAKEISNQQLKAAVGTALVAINQLIDDVNGGQK